MYRVIYHFNCFYWAVLDEHGNEVFWGMTKEECEDWVRNH